MSQAYGDSSLRNIVNSRGFISKQITSRMYLTSNRGALTVWGRRASSASSPSWLAVWPVYLYIPFVVIVYVLIVVLAHDYPLALFAAVMVAVSQMLGIIFFKTVVSNSRRRAWRVGRIPGQRTGISPRALVSLAECYMTDADSLRLTDTQSDLLDLHYGWAAPLGCELAARVASLSLPYVQDSVYRGVLDVCSSKPTCIGELVEGVQAVIDASE